jgi:hypothetical protein
MLSSHSSIQDQVCSYWPTFLAQAQLRTGLQEEMGRGWREGGLIFLLVAKPNRPHHPVAAGDSAPGGFFLGCKSLKIFLAKFLQNQNIHPAAQLTENY